MPTVAVLPCAQCVKPYPYPLCPSPSLIPPPSWACLQYPPPNVPGAYPVTQAGGMPGTTASADLFVPYHHELQYWLLYHHELQYQLLCHHELQYRLLYHHELQYRLLYQCRALAHQVPPPVMCWAVSTTILHKPPSH